jgi:hypothetical protein
VFVELKDKDAPIGKAGLDMLLKEGVRTAPKI